MSDALYERYKDALRRGHVAAERSRADAALEAYGEAARLAPDRALPLVGIGTVLTRLGKADEALAAFEAALERAPADEAALRARAGLLLAAGDRAGAAATLDRLVSVLEAAGRDEEALEAAGRALDLAETRGHRSGLRALVGRVGSRSAADPAIERAVGRAQALLDARVVTDASEPAVAQAPDATEAPDPTDVPGTADAPDAMTEPEAPAIAPDAPPPLDLGEAVAAIEEAAARRDPAVMRELAAVAAEGLRAAGQADAALDVCYLALAADPADPGVHLALAELYLDRGWDALAVDKLVLLARIIELADDPASRERLCAVVARRLPDEPRLAPICA